jgi:hypothetical protein
MKPLTPRIDVYDHSQVDTLFLLFCLLFFILFSSYMVQCTVQSAAQPDVAVGRVPQAGIG